MSRQSFVTLKIEHVNVALLQLVQYALYTCFLDYGLLKYILFYCGFWVAKYLVVVFWWFVFCFCSCCYFCPALELR